MNVEKMSQKCMLRLTLRQQSYKIKSATDCAILERKNVAEAVSRRYLKNIEKSWKKEQINGADGKDGVDGINGTDGKDGVSVTNAEINSNGELVPITFPRLERCPFE